MSANLRSNKFAFPRSGNEDSAFIYEPTNGMTLREYYAAQAMVGILGNSACAYRHDARDVAVSAAAYADALIAALEATP